jgi:hypothetical protein
VTEPTLLRPTLVGRMLVALAVGVTAVAVAVGAVASPAAASVASNDWLGIVNAYRAQSGLAPVSEEPSWSAGGQLHSCWMLLNGISHEEQPGTPGYTVAGDAAGRNGNVAVSSSASATARSHIDLWMTGPFHAIGLLRSSFTRSGFGMCANASNTATPWRSAATLDVLRGINPGIQRTAPVVFPGNGATTSLTRFIAETPDPRSFCGWGGRTVGLPLIALMPSSFGGALASLSGPSGPVGTCVLTAGNTSGVARSVLSGDNAVVIVPAAPLTAGVYTAAVVTNNGQGVNWTFTVDPNAVLGAAPAPVPPAPLPTTAALAVESPFQPVTPFRFADSRHGQAVNRLPAGQQVRVRIAGQQGLPADTSAVSANFTVDRPGGGGYLTASNCAEANPSVSTLNFTPAGAVANQAIIPLNGGDLCLFSSVPTDVVIDVNGYVSPVGTQTFTPVPPTRLRDTRSTVPLIPGQVLRIPVAGGSSPAPSTATAVAVNLTTTRSWGSGWIRAFPCGVAEPAVSTLNPRVGHDLANSAIIPTGADGSICVTSDVATDVLLDLTGWFGASPAQRFVPVTPVRLTDTRSAHPGLNGGGAPRMLEPGREFRVQIAGARGLPADARAAKLNLVALDGPGGGWLRVVPCGGVSGVSNLNFPGVAPVANGTNVMLDGGGAVCVTTSTLTHVIVDVTGVWR